MLFGKHFPQRKPVSAGTATYTAMFCLPHRKEVESLDSWITFVFTLMNHCENPTDEEAGSAGPSLSEPHSSESEQLLDSSSEPSYGSAHKSCCMSRSSLVPAVIGPLELLFDGNRVHRGPW